MSDYISREEAVRIVEDIDTWCAGWRDYAKDKIAAIPAADVRPVVRGKWEEVEVIWLADIEDQPDAIASMFCPKCKRFANHVYHYGDPTYCMNYCPNCGADMRETNDEKA